MGKAQLTIIIPFLNEKEEVQNTVNSIRNYSDKDTVDIILINDASDDGFNYQKIAEEYDVMYILNEKRLGVAASRDLGVMKTSTPYVMFLDAHMRFYDNIWVERIISELRNESHILLCCQTKGLVVVDDNVVAIDNPDRPISYGACVDLYNREKLFECRWIYKENEEDSNLQTIYIPAVLGASYACSKEYWLYLKGLSGLIFYGNDEAYISIKVWLEGGRCKMLKDIVVGHIYRESPPYIVESAPRIYNRLLITELLLPEHLIARIFSQLKTLFEEVYNEALLILYNKRETIYPLKNYYKEILKHEFPYFEKLNNQFGTFIPIREDKDTLLEDIAQHIILTVNLTSDIGLVTGQMGIVIFLFHYSQYVNNIIYEQFAYKILENVLDRIANDIPLNFGNGLTGIGWGIEYLYQNKFIEGDTNDILEEFDKKILEIDIDTFQDWSLDDRLAGILHYILARLYTIKNGNKHNPFDHNFLLKIYDKAKYILAKDVNVDSLSLYYRYVIFFEGLAPIHKPSIYNIMYFVIPPNYEMESFVPGLDGNAGVGLKLIFENLK